MTATRAGSEPAALTPRDLLGGGSLALVLLFLVKVYAVAHYSLTTAAALVVATPVQVSLGTLSIYAYLAMPAIALGTVWVFLKHRAGLPSAVWPGLLLVAAFTALISPAPYLVTGSAALMTSVLASRAAAAALRRHPCRPGLRGGVLRSVHRHAFLYLGGALLVQQLATTLETPWIAAEVFELSSPAVVSTHDDPADSQHLRIRRDAYPVGYPLAADDQWFTILDARTRYVVHIPAGDVLDRRTCHQEDDQLHGHRPLLWALTGRSYNSPNTACGVVRRELGGS